MRDHGPYWCGGHAHATLRHVELCQGPPQPDSIPELGVTGFIHTIRPPRKRDDD